jgi:hypothetical protein
LTAADGFRELNGLSILHNIKRSIMMSDMQRREFLTGATGLAAAATAALAGARPATGDDQPPQPVRGNKGAPIIGPSNPSRQAQSPDRVSPPATDSGTLPTLRWSFTDSHIKMREGGWSRQTTIREIPVSTDLALVNMRLKAGGVRGEGNRPGHPGRLPAPGSHRSGLARQRGIRLFIS